MPVMLIALTTLVFMIIVVLVQRNDSVQQRLKLSLEKAQKKYAEDIASGDVIVEQQTEKHIYLTMLWIFLAVLIVIICESYFFDKIRKAIDSCELLLGIFSFYWILLVFTACFIMTLMFICLTWWRDYQRILKTGYNLSKESHIFIRILKKQNLKLAKLKLIGGVVMLLCFGILTLHSLNEVVIEQTEKRIMSYPLIKEKSQHMQQSCLVKLNKH